MTTIRRSRDGERGAILAIVNSAAEAYRGVIPEDRWHEPYMAASELELEVSAGVEFWVYEVDGVLAGTMGIQPVRDVDLIATRMCTRTIRGAELAARCSGTCEA